MSIEGLGKVWPEWKVESLLGEGSFGKVYKAVRVDHGVTTYSAIKVVSIPQNDAELSSLRSEGWSEGATKTYFQGIVDDFVSEIKLMYDLKGSPNIVGVEDYSVLGKTDKVGWDIFIRMELLTSFLDYASNKKDQKMTEDEVIKLGEDILSALELCTQKKIIHRDIKLENIFISSFGYFKLGDFGIARELEKTAGSMSQKGTYNYMAPEVANGRHYDATVDTYSLGIVLYRLLNNNKLPFLDPKAQLVQYQDRKAAIDRRFNGEPLASPVKASKSMAQVILKACAFNPKDRYKTPTEFKLDLEAVRNGMEIPKFVPTAAIVDDNKTQKGRPAPEMYDDGQHGNRSVGRFDNGKRKKNSSKIAVLLVAVLILGGLGVGALIYMNGQKVADNVNQVIGALQDQNFSVAVEIFNDELDGKSAGAIESELNKRLDTVKFDFKNGTTDYNVAIMELNTIKGFGIDSLSTKLNSTEQYIESLNNSRVAYSMAETLYNAGDYAGAIEQYHLVTMDDTNYQKAKEGVTKSVAEFKKDVLSQSAELAASNDFDQAMELLNDALTLVGNDAELTRQRETYKKQDISDKIKDAQALADASDYRGSVNALKQLQAENPDSSDVSRALSDMENKHIGVIVSHSGSLADEDKFDEAYNVLNEGLKLYPDNAIIKNTVTETHTKEVNNIFAQADILANEKKYADAIKLLSDNKSSYPDSASDFQKKIEEYTKYLPVRLTSIKVSENSVNGFAYTTERKIDTIGNEYDANSIWIFGYTNLWETVEGFGTYNLGKEYKTLSCIIAVADATYTDAPNGVLSIYGDDKLLYTTDKKTRASTPMDVKVDVSGVEWLTIKYEGELGWNKVFYFIMADAALSK